MDWESVHELVKAVWERQPDAVALACRGEAVSYGELGRSAGRLAGFLAAHGCAPGTRVALLLEDTVQVVTAILAVLEAGGVFVPLDPVTPRERLETMIRQVSPAWLLAEPGYRRAVAVQPELVEGGGRVLYLAAPGERRADGQEGLQAAWAAFEAPRSPAVERPPDDLCSIYFTSGSTGVPKAIAGRLKALDHFIRWEAALVGAGPGTRVSQLTTPAFDAFLRDAFLPLCSGGTLCAPPGRESVLDTERLLRWLDEEKVEIVHCVPSLFRRFLAQGLEESRLRALRHVLLAGEPLLPGDVEQWRRVFGDRIELFNLYGPTETTMTKLFHRVRAEDARRRSVPIGKPMPGAQALVLNEDGEPCRSEQVGEIVIRTPYRSLGYYRQPELTRQAFVPNPFSGDPEDLIYRTGDLGRMLPDGSFEFVGRKDQQVKIRGVRVELAEVEACLGRQAGVEETAVVTAEDAEGNRYLCAYVVTEPEVEVDALRRGLAASLPEAMIPSYFERLEALPRTLTGKVDRRALAERQRLRSDETLPPRDGLELQLVRLWEELLRASPIGVRESFFHLGGHSLLAVRLVAEVRRRFGCDLALTTLFQGPTIEDLARVLRHEKAVPDTPLVPLGEGGDGVPLYCVHPAGGGVMSFLHLARHLGPGRPIFGLQARGFGDGRQPRQTIAEMAASYLEAVVAASPAGPYCLLGWSMGGLVAFEMAQRLIAEGRWVGLLVLCDTFHPRGKAEPGDDQLLEEFLELALGIPGDELGVDFEGDPEEEICRLLQRLQRRGVLPPEVDLAEARSRFEVYKANVLAARRYSPAPYRGRITLFRAAERPEGAAEDDPLLGWGGLASRGIEAWEIAGSGHGNFLHEPHVRHLAEKLSPHLQIVDRAGVGSIEEPAEGRLAL